MTVNTNSDPTTGRARRRKVAAVLAGGLVLGVGTLATLASWNDSEFANATITAGRFVLAGSTNGTTFTDHTAAGNTVFLCYKASAAETGLAQGQVGTGTWEFKAASKAS